MNVTLTLFISGFAVGFASGGMIWLYMLLSRPSRKIRNRIVIHVGQAFVGICGIGGLLLVQALEQRLSIGRRSSSHDALLYAYVFGLLCVLVFTLRGEFRWRRSVGLVTSAKNTRPVVPGAKRRLLIAFGILALSIGFSVGYWLNWPKPIAVIFGSISLLFAFAAMIFLGRNIGGEQMREMRTVTFVLAAALFCMFGGLAWKFRNTDPVLSSAWLVTLAMPCLVALSAFFFLRPTTGQRSSPP
jgi:hypothetical protein